MQNFSALKTEVKISTDIVVTISKYQYLFFCLRSSICGFCLLPRLPAPSRFPSITCFRRQFLCKMWPIHIAFLRFVVCSMFLSFWLYIILPYFTRDWYSWCFPWEFWVIIELQIHSLSTSFSDQPHFDIRSSDALTGTFGIGQSPMRTINFSYSPPWWSNLRDPCPCHT